jgi:CheY-like chemotaxis protein
MDKRILIVDDDQDMTSLLKLIFSRLEDRPEVETANSGQEALEKMAARPCDLVVTDLWMPGMSGLELITQIRARYPQTRLILVTACSTPTLRDTARQLKLQGYFTKPFPRKELLATAEAALT